MEDFYFYFCKAEAAFLKKSFLASVLDCITEVVQVMAVDTD